jgi:enoyl-CoA hydratase
MEYQQIIYQPGKVARLILNRPRYHNAQSRLLREEMDDAFVRATDDDGVGVIVLSGNGKHFSSGHDLGTPPEMEDREERGYPTTAYGRYDYIRAINMENTLRWRNVPKPTIAMVHGYCIFGGWMFAAAMDLVFASEDALFLPSNLQYFSIPWDVGPRKAKEILYEHRFMTAWEACEHGFVNRVFQRERLEEETLAYAGRVADNYLRDPIRLRTTKFSVNHMLDTMGYTTEVEAGYQNFFIAAEVRDVERQRDDKGGIAQASLAHANLEASRTWLESVRQAPVDEPAP